ncbi:hypothetical protein PR202_ga22917 [Eleusine coracana subsp. coracana]|uniref:CRM domain-containing protein n=1 Tax=Eleusine coracana subsp. coracana TaxID=191504 RepID=A0AAV5D4V6_ELECO|nr:hypothetical protein PR202_ga22917 [Eleusine coracana subsp. coracana]
MATAPLLPARSVLVPPQQSNPRPHASLRVCLSRYNEPSPDPKRRRDPVPSHPAFSPAARRRAKKIPISETGEPAAGVRVTDRGLAYHLDGAPFEFQYSYTEAPRARPVALREAPYLPFGPEATPRPWTGRKPLPKSRKEMPEFDSFVLPPPGKKGVKPVQSPGPFLAGMEPRYQAASREEVLGEPLTKEEIADLVNGSVKTKRQLNIVYPRLVKKVPDGLTPEEVTEMRQRGRHIPPICKLGKNGVYVNLVKQVREAFEVCDLVRVDCSDLNKSDCRKIGAKLKDLVPSILLSFEFEHILMWRGKDWKLSLPLVKETNFEVTKTQEHFRDQELNGNVGLTQIELAGNERSLTSCNLGEGGGELNDCMEPNLARNISFNSATEAHTALECSPSNPRSDFVHPSLTLAPHSQTILSDMYEKGGLVYESFNHSASSGNSSDALEPSLDDELEATWKDSKDITGSDILNSSSKMPSYMERVVLLLKQAIDNGSAVVLNETEFVDYNLVYQKSVALAKSSPRGPVFHDTQRRSNAKRNGPDKHVRIKKLLVENKISTDVEKKENGSGGLAIHTNDHAEEFLSDVVPQGTLRVDELAKLLA